MTSLNRPTADSVRVGTLLKDTTNGEVFKVKCNCPSVFPRYHTLRSVQGNIDKYVLPTTQEILDGPIL